MTFNGNWAHSDNDGDTSGLGMGYFDLVRFLLAGGKAVYLNRTMAMRLALPSGGAQLPLGDFLPSVRLIIPGFHVPALI